MSENKDVNKSQESPSHVDLIVIKSYWYKTERYSCPVCGRTKKYKYRVYSKKPDRFSERFTYKELYDHCMELAL